MQGIFHKTALAAIAGVIVAGTASAQVVVNSNITTSTTWTANNQYELQGQVYVEPGATLTIEAGTVIASDPTPPIGSLAVAKGGQIHVLGNRRNPVIMTSTEDVATWTAGDPRTGVWREAANEWGNLTIMGAGYISENAVGTNVPTCDPGNVADMEGLVFGPSLDRYGGGNDNDDSGTVRYLNIRYGGLEVSLNNELNGLSLGGIGRGTDIHHLEIMNNVDDGIEIWGGTVNLKHFSIWNIGDDSFDVDQGWRGQAQFGLIVQGYSLDASQGSGVGDNMFETDGAEQSSWQPVTTATIYNCTAIGQPIDGDHGMAFRDNARVQYRQCIFEDVGEHLVRFDNLDGDGGLGYGFGGTLSWPATWTTSYTQTSTVNPCANPAARYQSQFSGNLIEVVDSVFKAGPNTNLTEATARGVLPGNMTNGNDTSATTTLRKLVRAAPVLKGGKVMLQVIELDPTPKIGGLAHSANGTRPAQGSFLEQVDYRGAFAPGTRKNWLCDWSSSYRFGFLAGCDNNNVDLNGALVGQ